MAGDWTLERALEDIERLALRAQTRELFFDEAAARLKRAVPHVGACWHTLDPGSDLITQHRLQDIADAFPVLARNEYTVDDANKFTDLARSERKASTLLRATGGDLDLSPRYRELLSPRGIGAELRCSFVSDGLCWGSVILFRESGAPDFDDAQVELFSRLSPVFAQAVRRGLVSEAATNELVPANAPGLVEFDSGGTVAAWSSTAEPLLAELSGESVDAGVRSAALHTVASAMRAPADIGGSEPVDLPMAAVKTPGGSWLVLHGGLLGSGGEQRVGVFIQRAHPTLVAPLLLKAYGLTAREEQVSQLVLRGATTAQIAQRLTISPYTVTDHLKSIFDKTGARTRGELSVQLFFDQHLPRIQATTAIGDDASFADAPRPRGRLE
jgi:DNA-binding CsgD family transcriptional regulator